jgi:hypothetical protein
MIVLTNRIKVKKGMGTVMAASLCVIVITPLTYRKDCTLLFLRGTVFSQININCDMSVYLLQLSTDTSEWNSQ